jgi:hypothetical protein
MRAKKSIILLVSIVLLSASYAGAVAISLPSVNVTLNVVNGTSSYFSSTLSGVPVGFDVTNGVYEGWCCDRTTEMPRGVDLSVRLYLHDDPAVPAAFQDDDWDLVDWILNNHAGYTRTQIQWAIWYFLNEYTGEEINAPMVQQLITGAVQHNGFTPASGQLIAVIAVPVRTDAQCSFIEVLVPGDYEGKTPGFWKNHPQAWTSPYTPSRSVSSVFSGATAYGLGGDSLMTALSYAGGGSDTGAARILLRQAVAAVLNAAHPQIDYPLSVDSIVSQVNAALASHNRDTMLDLKDTLDEYNNLGADL